MSRKISTTLRFAGILLKNAGCRISLSAAVGDAVARVRALYSLAVLPDHFSGCEILPSNSFLSNCGSLRIVVVRWIAQHEYEYASVGVKLSSRRCLGRGQ